MEEMKKIHFVGVGGVGMGSFAKALASYGYEVTGSDHALYEPMKSVLANANIRLIEGFDSKNLELVSPSAVIIGNVVTKSNPEAAAWIKSGVHFLSFPEAVRTLLLRDKKSIVCSGTHGKTTTTSWLAFLLQELGARPSYLIGGVPCDLEAGCLITDGNLCVVEGDEYDSAFFDKGPKFLHYNPHLAIVSSIEFDHADIYRDLAHVRSSFEKLITLVPGDGLVVARYEDPVVSEVIKGALSVVHTYGTSNGALWRVDNLEESKEGFVFDVLYKGRNAGRFSTSLFGEHNLLNLLSGIVVAINLGYSMDLIRPITERFKGVKRRQEVLSISPITVIDDFAHHPTEVAATISAVRRRFPKGKLWALFEPRSATARRNVHQEAYAKAFAAADDVLLCSPYRAQELDESLRFSTEGLVQDLQKQKKNAQCFDNADQIVDFLSINLKPNDIVLVMSNGEFGKIQSKILKVISR